MIDKTKHLPFCEGHIRFPKHAAGATSSMGREFKAWLRFQFGQGVEILSPDGRTIDFSAPEYTEAGSMAEAELKPILDALAKEQARAERAEQDAAFFRSKLKEMEAAKTFEEVQKNLAQVRTALASVSDPDSGFPFKPNGV